MKTISSFSSKLLALTLALMAGVSSFAYEFEYVNDFHIDGFAYSINSTSANNDSEEGYVGLIEIADCQKDLLVPKYVSYGDRGFHVTKFGMGSVVFTNEAGSVVESVTIPNTTYVINKNVLAGCPNLKTVVVDSENPYYDSRENCNAIITTSQNPYFTPNTLIAGCKTTIIPNSVVEIGANAFYNCQSLETITIPNSVTKIGRSAFNACSALSSITLSENLTAIGDWAFDDCNNLIEVVCYATQPPTISQYTFSGISPTIYVPAESIEQYRAADGWKDFQIQYISWSEGCEEYKHINLAVQMLPKISSMIFDISNNGTIEPPYVDSVWILKTEQEPLRKLDAQSGDTIDLSFLEENEDYILRVYINGCIKSRTFWHRVIPNNWPDTWCDTWNVMWFDGWFFDETASTSKYRLGKDTIIGDYTYSKFTSRTSVRFTEDWKVYVYYEGFDDNDPYTQDLPTGEYLAYDFSAQVGDTLEVFSGVHSYSKYKCLVREVQTDPETKLRTITLFQLLLEDTDGDGVEEEYGRGEMTWIEGVGSPNGFLINTPPTGGGTFALLCAYKDDELKYTGSFYERFGCEYNAGVVSDDLFPTLSGLQRTICREYYEQADNKTRIEQYTNLTTRTETGAPYIYCSPFLLREKDNKILIYSRSLDKDLVLYDFNLQVGDSLPMLYIDFFAKDDWIADRDMEIWYVVDYHKDLEGNLLPADTLIVTDVSAITLLDGKEYKKWTFNNGMEYVEGIGSFGNDQWSGDFFQLIANKGVPTSLLGEHLVCASKNNKLLYQMDNAEMERLGTECLCEIEPKWSETWCNQWNILSHGYLGPQDPLAGARTSIYWLSNNTVNRSGQEYIPLMCSSSMPNEESTHLVGELRFTEDKQVYFYYAFDETEYLLYDFGAELGDTLELFAGLEFYDYHKTYTHVITDKETLDDGRLQIQADVVIRIDNGAGEYFEEKHPVTWIEGLGSTYGIIFNPSNPGVDGDGAIIMLCAYRDDECVYTTNFSDYKNMGCVYNNDGTVDEDLFPTLWGLQRTVCNEYCGETEDDNSANFTYKQTFDSIFFENDKPYILCNGYLLREEDNKIFLYSQSLNKDIVLYDFTLEVGDSLPAYIKDFDGTMYSDDTLVVTDISSVTLLDGKEYKKWTFDNGMEYVEGIGMYGGHRNGNFFGLIQEIVVPCHTGTHLVCASKNGKLLYQMDDAEMERLGTECLCDVEKKWSDTWCDTWNIMEHNVQLIGDYNEETWRHYLAEDTTINGTTYTTVNRYWTADKTKRGFVATIRFTEDQKVYALLGDTEYLVYDFSVQVGDTIETIVGVNCGTMLQQLLVHQVDIDDATNRKTITLYPLCQLEEDVDCDRCDENGYYLDLFPIQWIEGVGSTDGFLMGDRPCSDWVGGIGHKLLCAYKDDELQYINDLYQDDYGCEYNAVGQNPENLFPTLWGLQRTSFTEYFDSGHQPESEPVLLQAGNIKEIGGKLYLDFGQYLREENGKIYIYSELLQKDFVLYDFTLELGDTLTTLNWDYNNPNSDGTISVVDYAVDCPIDTLIVTDISTITLLDGKEYKKWIFNHGYFGYVESIGTLSGLFYELSQSCMVVPGCYMGDHLVCASRNGQLLYQMDDAEMERLGTECLCDYDSGHRKDNAKDGQIGGRPTPTQWNQLEVVLREMDNNHTILQAETFSYTLEDISQQVNNKTYFQLARQSTKDTATTKSVVGALHFGKDEDNRVYFLRDGVEYVLYDFTAEPGDTVEIFAGINNYPQETTYTHVVTGKDTLENGACRMLLEVVFPDETNTTAKNAEKVWLAGLGSVDGIVHNAAKRASNAHAAPNRSADSNETESSVMLCAWREDSCLYTTDHPDYDSFGCVYNQDPTSIEDTHSPSPIADYQKLLRNGQLLIIHNGKTYNVLGVAVE